MHVTLVVVGLVLSLGGWIPFRSSSKGLTRGRAVGLALFVVGEVMLFGEGWWWGLTGLVVPTLLGDAVLGVARAVRRPRPHGSDG